jgi:integrase
LELNSRDCPIFRYILGGKSRITINTAITALRFFFETTVGDKNIVGKLKTVPVPRKLAVVLSRDEGSRLLEATSSLKY